MYNWNMENKLYCGVLDPSINTFGRICKKKMDIYINVGNYLIDVKRVKSEKMYEKYLINKDAYKSSIIADQHLLNDVAYGQIGYIPMKFGLKPPFENDKLSDTPPYDTNYKFFDNLLYKESYPFIPRNRKEMNLQAYNPVVVHQYNGKWMKGEGISIYRRLAQYYIKLAGIWDEMCGKHPGYCTK